MIRLHVDLSLTSPSLLLSAPLCSGERLRVETSALAFIVHPPSSHPCWHSWWNDDNGDNEKTKLGLKRFLFFFLKMSSWLKSCEQHSMQPLIPFKRRWHGDWTWFDLIYPNRKQCVLRKAFSYLFNWKAGRKCWTDLFNLLDISSICWISNSKNEMPLLTLVEKIGNLFLLLVIDLCNSMREEIFVAFICNKPEMHLVSCCCCCCCTCVRRKSSFC